MTTETRRSESNEQNNETTVSQIRDVVNAVNAAVDAIDANYELTLRQRTLKVLLKRVWDLTEKIK